MASPKLELKDFHGYKKTVTIDNTNSFAFVSWSQSMVCVLLLLRFLDSKNTERNLFLCLGEIIVVVERQMINNIGIIIGIFNHCLLDNINLK